MFKEDFKISGGTLIKYDGNDANVVIPEGVTTIGQDAFANSMIESVVFPSTLKCIKVNAFKNCEFLEEIRLPDSLESLLGGAFACCKLLRKVYIPKSVSDMWDNPFTRCDRLEYIEVDKDNPYFDSRNNCNAIISTAENCLIVGSSNTIIPKTVEVIGNDAFCGNRKLTSIDIPDKVEEIGIYAFWGCENLKEVSFGKNIIEIREYAFEDCKKLKDIKLPESLKIINQNAFLRCYSLEKVVIPKNVIHIGNGAFSECIHLNEVEILGNPDKISNAAFPYEANIKPIISGKRLVYVPKSEINKRYVVPEGIEEICDGVFQHCMNLDEIVLPKSLKRIGWYAFYNTHLQSIELPDGLEEIREFAFQDTYISEVRIPKSVINIGCCVFLEARNLQKIIVDQDNPIYDSRNNCNAIVETETNKIIIACCKTTIEPTIEIIGEKSFCCMGDELKIKEIPSSVKRIEKNAFLHTKVPVILSDNINFVSGGAFSEIGKIERIRIPHNEFALKHNWRKVFDSYNYSPFEKVQFPSEGNYVKAYVSVDYIKSLMKVEFVAPFDKRDIVKTPGEMHLSAWRNPADAAMYGHEFYEILIKTDNIDANFGAKSYCCEDDEYYQDINNGVERPRIVFVHEFEIVRRLPVYELFDIYTELCEKKNNND